MPRGGARPGAGRPRKPLPAAVVDVRQFPDLVARLAKLPKGTIGLPRRAALALGAYDVPDDVVAAALGLTVDRAIEFYGDDLRHGQVLAQVNILRATWALAEAGKWPAISHLLRRMEAVGDDRREIDIARREAKLRRVSS